MNRRDVANFATPALLGFAGITLGIVTTVNAAPVDAPTPVPTPDLTVSRLIATHRCWTSNDAAPANTIPGHAVVTVAGKVRYVGPALTSDALEKVINHAPSEIETVHAFCR